MGVVSKYILNLIAKQVEDNGIVDWYDPDRAYSEAVKALDLPGSTILRYDGSFVQLRWEIDDNSVAELAKRSRGVPRLAIRLLESAKRV